MTDPARTSPFSAVVVTTRAWLLGLFVLACLLSALIFRFHRALGVDEMAAVGMLGLAFVAGNGAWRRPLRRRGCRIEPASKACAEALLEALAKDGRAATAAAELVLLALTREVVVGADGLLVRNWLGASTSYPYSRIADVRRHRADVVITLTSGEAVRLGVGGVCMLGGSGSHLHLLLDALLARIADARAVRGGHPLVGPRLGAGAGRPRHPGLATRGGGAARRPDQLPHAGRAARANLDRA